ncbi:MAG: effector binding domain-containing protein [Pseudomonadales bacterium]|nr:effector binding domain-containing protein [Pseudomonadales bacterium]
MTTELTTSQNENSKIISQHWRNFNRHLRNNKLWQGKGWVKYGITKKVEDKYFYMTAIESNVTIPSLEKYTVIAGEFIRFQHVGSLERIKLTISDIYRKVIPSQCIKLNANRVVVHYERYDYRFNWNDPNSIIDIYVPVDYAK